MSIQTLSMSAIREELFLHYWLFGSDNVLKDMNDEFWHDELQLDVVIRNDVILINIHWSDTRFKSLKIEICKILYKIQYDTIWKFH